MGTELVRGKETKAGTALGRIIEIKDTKDRTTSCNICNANNYDGKTPDLRVFELHLGHDNGFNRYATVIRLCPTCLSALRGTLAIHADDLNRENGGL